VAERQFGPYRLVRQIAVGGMAELHLAKTKGIAGFEKYCALKMIHPNFAEDEQFIQMLVDEAKIAVELTHGNIAQTFDLGHVGDTYYITMEYVDGADLYKILRRASEQDLEIPLDLCAFVAKEVASALDYAHRKRDHTGKPLGIVHRDVSPQNVLISYAGEVKLVDFGIAKATMKVRQTAVGVIKGKYYYMSPEQAWGDPIDYRSDIFSSGIVLYEMITGQMLYLEEDLHKLLDMARKADIAPPGRLRKGVPPQLERIVMHALAKQPGDRYQSAGDFASDLERFLHTYAPVFTAGKVAGLIRKVIGDPMQVPIDEPSLPSIEMRDGPNATHQLDTDDLIHEREEIRDENSVIFRISDLGQKQQPQQAAGPDAPPRRTAATPASGQAKPASTPGRAAAPRTTRAADPLPGPPAEPARIPSIARSSPGVARPSPAAARPRKRDDETRPVINPVAPDPGSAEDSGLLTPDGHKVDRASWDRTDTQPGLDGDLDNIGERTMVTGGMMGGFMMDIATEDGIDATLVSAAPPQPFEDGGDETTGRGRSDDDGPTLQRDAPRIPSSKVPPPALAAKIHAPAVSELRKPRPSRRTPPGGAPQPNVLQQIVGSRANEPMPVPRATMHAPTPTPPSMPTVPVLAPPLPAPPAGPPPNQFSPAPPGVQVQYIHDASGLPMVVPTPPAGFPAVEPGQPPAPGYPGMAPGSPGQQGEAPPGYAPQPYGSAQSPYPVLPGGLYQLSPYNQRQQPLSLTGQLRLSEIDEIPSLYKIRSTRRRWFAYVVAGLIAVSFAAGTTFFIIRASRETAAVTGSIHIESVPPGGEVYFNGTQLTDRTPLTIEGVPVGTRHEIRVELPRHKSYAETVDIPKTGGEISVTAVLQIVPGKIVVNSQPGGAEIWIDGQLRGRTPTTLNDIDMGSSKKLEIRLKGYQPFVTDLAWPSNGQIMLDPKLLR
jgi:eukaryotic-like serine/threonine-protein kinase